MVQDDAMDVLLMAEPCLQPVLTNTAGRVGGGEDRKVVREAERR